MNAVFQQLFMQPALRRLLLQHKDALHEGGINQVAHDHPRNESVLFQVQVGGGDGGFVTCVVCMGGW